MNLIKERPRSADVLLGRGKGSYEHKGNKAYMDILSSYLPAYEAATKNKHKIQITEEIVARVKKEGGRFLGIDKKEIYEVSDGEARIKVSQALRHRRYMLNRQKGGHVGVNEEDCSGVSSASSCSEGESGQKEEETIHVFEPSVEGKLPSSLVAAMRYLLQEPVSCHRSCSLEAAQRFQVQEPSSCSEGESGQKEEETIHVFEPSVEGKPPSSLVAAICYLLQEPVSCRRSERGSGHSTSGDQTRMIHGEHESLLLGKEEVSRHNTTYQEIQTGDHDDDRGGNGECAFDDVSAFSDFLDVGDHEDSDFVDLVNSL